MPKLSPAERIAEAPPPTHPAVVDRLAKEAVSFALVLDRCDAATFATGEPWEALETLAQSLESLMGEAELHRPTVHP